MITEKALKDAVDRIVENVHPEKIIVFGSCAKSLSHANDLDLFVILESPDPPHERITRIRKALRPHHIPIDILAYTPDEVAVFQNARGTFVNDVLENGKVLYG